MQVVVVADNLQFHYLRKPLYHFVGLSTSLIIGFNYFEKIQIKEFYHTKKKSKQPLHRYKKLLMIMQKNIKQLLNK